MSQFLFNALARYWLVISLSLLCAITVLSLSPLPELPNVPGGDKFHHLIAYASLAVPITVKGGPRLLMVLLFYILWSGAIELLQPYVNRYGELTDFFANILGVLLGAGIGVTVKLLFKPQSH